MFQEKFTNALDQWRSFCHKYPIEKACSVSPNPKKVERWGQFDPLPLWFFPKCISQRKSGVLFACEI